jgi:hypothetical protein
MIFSRLFHWDAGSYDPEFNSTKKSGQTADDMIENYSQNCSGISELCTCISMQIHIEICEWWRW